MFYIVILDDFCRIATNNCTSRYILHNYTSCSYYCSIANCDITTNSHPIS